MIGMNVLLSPLLVPSVYTLTYVVATGAALDGLAAVIMCAVGCSDVLLHSARRHMGSERDV